MDTEYYVVIGLISSCLVLVVCTVCFVIYEYYTHLCKDTKLVAQ